MTPREGSRSFGPGDGAARTPPGASPHIPELQSIRGLAALVVVIGHPISFYQPPDWFVTVWKLVNSQVAVEIFFILSGFVLANSLSRQAITGITVRNFYIKRLFRIYPALWFVSAFALLYVSFLHYNIHLPDEADWFRGRFQAERYTPIHILASFAGMLAYLSPPVWTIFVEMMGSLLLPGLAWLLFTRPYWFARRAATASPDAPAAAAIPLLISLRRSSMEFLSGTSRQHCTHMSPEPCDVYHRDMYAQKSDKHTRDDEMHCSCGLLPLQDGHDRRKYRSDCGRHREACPDHDWRQDKDHSQVGQPLSQVVRLQFLCRRPGIVSCWQKVPIKMPRNNTVRNIK